jgi:hypothetical protein
MKKRWIALIVIGGILTSPLTWLTVAFSVPYITKWGNGFNWDSSKSYYQRFQISLQGEVTGKRSLSNVDKLTDSLNDNSAFDWDYSTKTYADYQKSIASNAYGDKFFVTYVSSSCTNCEATQPGWAALQDGWGDKYAPQDGRSFKMYTIFTDETSSTDDADANKLKAFQRYLNTYQDFYQSSGQRLANAPYRHNASLDSSNDYTYFQNADNDNFVTPTILLVDYSQEAYNLKRPGVSEVLFDVSGDTKYEKANLLYQMWEHTSGDTSNPFSASYGK